MTSFISKILGNESSDESSDDKEAKQATQEIKSAEGAEPAADGDDGEGGDAVEGTEEEKPDSEGVGLNEYQLVDLVDDDGNPAGLVPPLLVPVGRFNQYVSHVVRTVLLELHEKEMERQKKRAEEIGPTPTAKSKKRRGRRARKHKMRYGRKEGSS